MENFLSIDQVTDLTGLSKNTIYRYMKTGAFPAQIHMGSRNVCWMAAEVYLWVGNCIDNRNVNTL